MNEPRDRIADLIHGAGQRLEPSAEIQERLRLATHAQWQAGLRLRRRRRLFAIAAAVALLGIGTAFLSLLVSTPSPVIVARLTQAADHQILRAHDGADALDSELLGVGDELRTSESQGITLAQLPHGTTSLRLAAHSRVRWKSADRIELLAGAIYVDTSHGGPGAGLSQPSRDPLMIEVGDARIEHIGTQFMAVRQGNEVKVQVRDGLVRVTLGNDSRSLARGESAIVPATGTGPIQIGHGSAADPAWQWADALAPRLSIEGRDLLTVLRTLAYQGGLGLRFATPALEAAAGTTTLHGPTLNLPPREAMRALLLSSGLDMAEDASDGGSVMIVAGPQ
jgi:ferric-dicitrate binding protein FerR (iron transport regulator)